MTFAHVKVCRECGEEYRPQATRCTDCGGELEERQLDDEGAFEETGAGPAGAEGAQAAEPDEPLGRVLFVTPRASELVPLAEALRDEELPYRLLERPARREGGAATYGLVVPEEVAAAAIRALAPLLAPEHDAATVAGLETGFEPERGYLRCPACGAQQSQGAGECSECGLGLGSSEEDAVECARCGAPLPDADRPCGACGSTRVG